MSDQVTTEQNAWGKLVGSWELGETWCLGPGIDCCSSASRGQRPLVPCLEWEGIGWDPQHTSWRGLCVLGCIKGLSLHAHVLTASSPLWGAPQNNLRLVGSIPLGPLLQGSLGPHLEAQPGPCAGRSWRPSGLKLWAMGAGLGQELPRCRTWMKERKLPGPCWPGNYWSPKTGRSQQARLTAVLAMGLESSVAWL